MVSKKSINIDCLPEAKSLKKCLSTHCRKAEQELKEVTKLIKKERKRCDKMYPFPKKCYQRLEDAKERKECVKAARKSLQCFEKKAGLTPSEKKLVKTLPKKRAAQMECEQERCGKESEKMRKASVKLMKRSLKLYFSKGKNETCSI